jgi:sec-independent protein translocase protein TatC
MALLTRRRTPRSVDDTRMSVIEHLEALRRALIVSVLVLVVTTVGCWFFSNSALFWLLNHAHITNAVVLNPTGGFMIRLKVAAYMGIVVASPIVVWQVWWFISPGLHSHEKRLILPLIAATSFFFLTGVGFALYALPLIMRVLTGFLPTDISYLADADNFLGFVLGIVLAFGVVFELPVVLYTLGMLRIISTRWLYQHRAYWIIGLGLVANLMTPGADPITPLIVFIPLYIFWEGTALILKLSGR